MKQDEAERLARDLRPPELAAGTSSDTPTYADAVGVVVTAGNLRRLCDHVLSGDMKREIENAAFERAAKTCETTYGWSKAGDKRVQMAATAIRALIQPPAQTENGE